MKIRRLNPSRTGPVARPSRTVRVRVTTDGKVGSRIAAPWGLFGMIGMVAAVELIVAGRPLDFSDPVGLCWRLTAQAAQDQAPRSGVLIVGDSLAKHGVIPKVVEAGTGRRAYNLAVAKGPAPATYFFLRRVLEAGARPAAVVVDFKPAVLIGGPEFCLRDWQEIVTPREFLELARATRDGRFLAAVMVGRLLPSFRGRHEVRAGVLAALRGEASPMRRINRICRRNWTVNDGANVAHRHGGGAGDHRPDDDRELLPHVGHCHRINAAYVEKVFALLGARGIRAYWLLPPLAPRLQAAREQSGAESKYLELVRKVQSRHPNVTILDARHAGYGPESFVDATHLDGVGATVLSTDIAAILRADLDGSSPGPRRIELPTYRERLATVSVEDVEQSRAIEDEDR